LRSAMVMSADRGGVFDQLLRLVRFGLGGHAGSGEQFVSWIHAQDFIRSIEFLISGKNFAGVVNIASPNPVRNREFMGALRRAWGARIGLPSPKYLLELGCLLLRTETELILKSRRVVPGRLLKSGFCFSFPDWPEAARELVDRWRKYA
jgi:NAD dependent epimerase/dehydratase family enzyme